MSRWRRGKQVEMKGLATALMGAPDAPIWILPAWFLGGVTVNVLSGYLGVPGLGFVTLLIVAGYVGWAWWRWRRVELVPEMVEQEPPGKHGLILPLSTIALLGGAEKEREKLPAALSRLADNTPGPPSETDFALLESSNLASPLRAIEYHHEKGTLRDCWLITTERVEYQDGTAEEGSKDTAEILKKWFFHRHPDALKNVAFHYGDDENLCVHPRDYARLWLLVDSLFERVPYKAESIIVDITPGTKPMTLAIALACLEPKRTMQYIVAGRDPLTGEVLPKGQKKPVLIDVDPYLYTEEPS